MSKYLIDFIDNTSVEEITSYLDEHQCMIISQYVSMPYVYHVSTPVTLASTSIIESIIPDDDVTVCNLLTTQVTQLVHKSSSTLAVEDQKDWWKAYSVRNVDFSLTTTTVPNYGENVNVYVVDSGIDNTHSEFTGKDVTLLHSYTGEFSDETGHGTGLASLIVGNTCGLTNANVKVVKLFGPSKSTMQSDILAALDAVIQDSLVSSNLFSVVNLSWAIPKNEYIEQKIRVLMGTGAAVVAAAGNSGIPIENVTPASMAEVMTIGSYGIDFTPSDFSDYSNPIGVSLTQQPVNYGQLDSWAPGEQIWCALPGNQFGYTAGTSCAAAIYTASRAYNQSQHLLSNLSITSYYKTPDGRYNWSAGSEGDRTGLLDLSNPKYITSHNRVCTFNNAAIVSVRNITNPIKIVAKVGEIVRGPFMVYRLTASYDILSTLPDSITIERDLFIYSPLIEPTNSSGVDIQIIEYRITDLNGGIFDNYLQLVTLSSTFDKTALPPNDPLIKITAMDTCFGTLPATGCPGHGCGGSGKSCASVSKSSCTCLY